MNQSIQEPGVVRQMFAGIAHRYDLANHLLSGGFDYLWRRRLASIVEGWKPTQILDLATGSGDVALLLERRIPGAEVTGADFCEPMLEQARRKGLKRTVVADAMALPFADCSFDAVTVAFGLRNMASYPGALVEMHRVIRPGGHLLVLDFSMPDAPLSWLYRPYLHHLLPRIAGALTSDMGAYEYLGESIEQFPRGGAMVRLFTGAGFEACQSEKLTAGVVSIYTGQRPV